MRQFIKGVLLVVLSLGLLGTAMAEGKMMDYQLGAGDAIKIAVFQNPDLNIETRVSENGVITYPLVGAVRIGGLTIADAERTIADKLREGGFVHRPQVNILLVQVRGNQVSVLGQVSRPGRYPIETFNTRVTDMLAMAGGAVAAGSDTIILTGVREGVAFRKEIDIPSLFLDAKSHLDLSVAGGDVIYVHRAPVFYIYGEVQRPGAYRLERNMTVLQALSQGGGLTVRGTEVGIRIHRAGADGKTAVIEPGKHERLQPDDVLNVQESFF